MSIFTSALDVIESNRHSDYNCIPFDREFPRLSEFIPGIQKKKYYLVSGSSGTGKSQLTDHMFVFTPFNFVNECKNPPKLKIFYFSLELDKETKMTQWMSRRLYDLYGIRTSMNILQSVGKNRLSADIYMAVLETRSYFEKFEENVRLIDSMTDVEEIKREIRNYANKNGVKRYAKEQVNGSEVVTFDKYVPNNENEYVIIIIDHYSLLSVPGGSNIKKVIED